VTDSPEPTGEAPALVVVHGGEPQADELAALVIAFDAMSTTERPGTPSGSGWRDRRALLRRPLNHGPGHWVASARPLR
jgi:hypothetical protein